VKWCLSGCQPALYLGRTKFLECSEVSLVEALLEAVVNVFHVFFLLRVSTPRGVGAFDASRRWCVRRLPRWCGERVSLDDVADLGFNIVARQQDAARPTPRQEPAIRPR
jgi:hypothetical protein